MYRDPRDTRAQDARSPPREWLICRREDRRNLRPVPRCVIWVLNREMRKLDVVNGEEIYGKYNWEESLFI